MALWYNTSKTPEVREIVERMNQSSLVEKWHKTTRITTYGTIRPADNVLVIASNRSGSKAV